MNKVSKVLNKKVSKVSEVSMNKASEASKVTEVSELPDDREFIIKKNKKPI
jgi:hypothetical protein